MKKLLSIILLLTLLLYTCVVCREQEYKAEIFSICHCSTEGVERKIETELFPVLDDSSAPKTKSISYGGHSYKCKFVTSSTDYYYNSTVYSYSFDDGYDKVSFTINANTGDIDSYVDFSDPITNNTVKTKGECEKEAFEIIKANIKRSNEYRLTDVTESNINVNSYTFSFQRFINDYATTEIASVVVTEYGQIVQFNFIAPNHMANSARKLPSETEMENIKSVVDDKVKAMHKDYTGEYSYTTDYTFTRLHDGDYAMICEITVTYPSLHDEDILPRKHNTMVVIRL